MANLCLISPKKIVIKIGGTSNQIYYRITRKRSEFSFTLLGALNFVSFSIDYINLQQKDFNLPVFYLLFDTDDSVRHGDRPCPFNLKKIYLQTRNNPIYFTREQSHCVFLISLMKLIVAKKPPFPCRSF